MNPRRETRIPVLPTALTLGNLVFGFLAIAKAVDALQWSGGTGPFDSQFADRIQQGCWFIVAAMIFDALDGRIARLTGQTSPFGAMLDSLADLVTFGVAPAFIAKIVYEHTVRALELPFRPGIVTTLCALYLIGATLRLARFTAGTDSDDDHSTFIGLPSPAAAMTVITACFFIYDGRREIGLSPQHADELGAWMARGLPYLACLLGVLMVSRVRYVHVAQRYVGQAMRPATFVKLVLVIWVTVFFHEWALFAGALIYVVGGMVLWLRAVWTGGRVEDALPDPWDVEDHHDEESSS
jgi:CDP-diacylglycerol--serine O-phosphatidyltransferase